MVTIREIFQNKEDFLDKEIVKLIADQDFDLNKEIEIFKNVCCCQAKS